MDWRGLGTATISLLLLYILIINTEIYIFTNLYLYVLGGKEMVLINSHEAQFSADNGLGPTLFSSPEFFSMQLI